MFIIALRDLQWRSRRIIVAVLGASLVLALALVMSGLAAGFDNESRRTVALARGTGWIVDENGTGPFLQPSPLTRSTVTEIELTVGEQHAAPMVFVRQSVAHENGKPFGDKKHINLVGVVPGRLGAPRELSGTALSGAQQALVDVTLGAKVGDVIRVGSQTVTVVGTVTGARLLAGVPNVYVVLGEAQRLAFGGQDLVTTVIVDRPLSPPVGTKQLSNSDAVTDGLLPVVNAKKTIAMVRSLLWLVAALIVGSVMYLGALERTKDVAVLKGMGTTSRALGSSIAVQAAGLAIGASLVAGVLASLLAPLFPISSEIPRTAFITLPVLAIAISLVASIGAARRLMSVQPALAFGN
jgi:putative ABC transport system permease protein